MTHQLESLLAPRSKVTTGSKRTSPRCCLTESTTRTARLARRLRRLGGSLPGARDHRTRRSTGPNPTHLSISNGHVREDCPRGTRTARRTSVTNSNGSTTTAGVDFASQASNTAACVIIWTSTQCRGHRAHNVVRRRLRLELCRASPNLASTFRSVGPRLSSRPFACTLTTDRGPTVRACDEFEGTTDFAYRQLGARDAEIAAATFGGDRSHRHSHDEGSGTLRSDQSSPGPRRNGSS